MTVVTSDKWETEANRIQQDTYVFDSLMTGGPGPRYVSQLLETGYNACNWTVGGHSDSFESVMHKIATYYWLRDANPETVHLVQSRRDLEDPALAGKLRIVMGFQGAEPLAHEFHNVSIFHALGIRVIQLTYNEGNLLGSGCLEPDDRGLTHFGIQVVRELNRLGMVVDVTHTSEKTSLDAISVSEAPVIFSHSNVKAIQDNPRNLTDEQIIAAAERGGVIGIAAFADFVADTTSGVQPNVDNYVDHIAYIAEKVGVDHVGIGTDIMEEDKSGMKGIWWLTNTGRRYPEICGGMDEHMHNTIGFDSHTELGNVTATMLRRGFSEADVRKVLGGNFMRVFTTVLHD